MNDADRDVRKVARKRAEAELDRVLGAAATADRRADIILLEQLALAAAERIDEFAALAWTADLSDDVRDATLTIAAISLAQVSSRVSELADTAEELAPD